MKLVPPDDSILRQEALLVSPAEFFAPELRQIAFDMEKFLRSMPGAIALAAPQVGISKQIISFALPDGRNGTLVNPEITAHSKKRSSVTEGCLTFPGRYWQVWRYRSVEVTAYMPGGPMIRQGWQGLGAQMMQHEIDHLNGILLPDIAHRRVQ